MKPAPTFERLWLAYLLSVVVVALSSADVLPRASLLAHLGVHTAVLVAVLVVRAIAVHRAHDRARVCRTALGLVGLPVVFSAKAWLLPHVHPEPYEWLFLQYDRSWFGGDPAVLLDRWLAPWFVECLQVAYAMFYLLPIAALVAVYRRSGPRGFDRALLLLVGGFLASYLGYLLVPTLAPKVVLAYARPVEGVWLVDPLRRLIDAGEANPWDCFPSGHTWLSVTSLIVVFRWHRRWFWILLLPALLLIASTVLLRYHWVVDVLVGAALAWPFARLCDHLADRDGWPPAPHSGEREVRAVP